MLLGYRVIYWANLPDGGDSFLHTCTIIQNIEYSISPQDIKQDMHEQSNIRFNMHAIAYTVSGKHMVEGFVGSSLTKHHL